MTGKKTYKEQENEQRLGKKKYIERLYQEQEAEEEIEEFLERGEIGEDYRDER